MSQDDEPASEKAERPPPADLSGNDELYRALLAADRSEALIPVAVNLGKQLNELLTAVLAGVSLGTPSEDPRLASAADACVAARELTRRLMSLGRSAAAGRAELAPRAMLEEAVVAAAVGQAADVTVAVAEAADAIEVDRAEVVQAFRALVRNAAEAMSPPPHQPRIQVAARNADLADGQIDGLAAGPYVEFEVRDNGHGIEPAILERIWEPFFTTKKHGSGIGLPTALAIIRRHGGQIGVDSDPGVGTVFTVFLPAAHRPAAAGGERSESSRFRTGRVLVMDDDDRVRDLFPSLLQRLDFKCDLVRTPDEAVVWYRRYWDVGRPYDIVILDLKDAPDEAALTALDQIRDMDPDVRAVAMAPIDPEELARRAKEDGFAGWLAKPFRLVELAEVLKTVGP